MIDKVKSQLASNLLDKISQRNEQRKIMDKFSHFDYNIYPNGEDTFTSALVEKKRLSAVIDSVIATYKKYYPDVKIHIIWDNFENKDIAVKIDGTMYYVEGN